MAVTTDARGHRDNGSSAATQSGRNGGTAASRRDDEEDEIDLEDVEDLYGSEDDSDDSLEDSDSGAEEDFINTVSHNGKTHHEEDAGTDAQRFSAWTARFNKQYESHKEYQERMGRWTQTEKDVHEANAAADASGNRDSVRLTLETPYADGTVRTGRLAHEGRRLEAREPRELQSVEAIDWVTAGNVTAVKDQGNCGSCYAFASNTALEAAISISEGTTPVRLSEQQIVDCSGSYGNWACQGGLETYSWAYQSAVDAITDADYSYESGTTGSAGTCEENNHTAAARVTNYSNFGSLQGAADIMDRLQTGPLSIGIQGENTYFYNYSSGILTETECPVTQIDHAVVVVGYSPGSGESTEAVTEIVTYTQTRCRRRRRRDYRSRTGCRRRDWYVHPDYRRYCCKDYEYTEEVVIEEGTAASDAYFLVQNSWGTSWGENGFVRFAVDSTGNGACGMNLEPLWVEGVSV